MRAGDLFPLSNEYPGLAWINACACACSVYVVLTAGEGALPCMAAQERQSQIRIDAHARTHARTHANTDVHTFPFSKLLPYIDSQHTHGSRIFPRCA